MTIGWLPSVVYSPSYRPQAKQALLLINVQMLMLTGSMGQQQRVCNYV